MKFSGFSNHVTSGFIYIIEYMGLRIEWHPELIMKFSDFSNHVTSGFIYITEYMGLRIE